MTQRCPNGHETPDGQRFCGECGQPLDADATSERASLANKEAPVDTRDGSERASRWSWLRSRAALVIGVWVVVLGVVLFLVVVPYSADKAALVSTAVAPDASTGKCPSGSTDLHGSALRDAPRLVAVPMPVYLPPDCAKQARVTFSLPCRSALTEKTSQPTIYGQPSKGTISDADLNSVNHACRASATRRLLWAGGIFVVAIIGTWLFFNLAPGPRKRKRVNAALDSAS